MDELVSIITPAFNNAGTLRETASSVFDQRYPHWEWIIVDNGSSDETAVLLDEFDQHERVRTVRLAENLGVSGGRNAGLEHARGNFLCFVDADDRLTRDSLLSRMQVMEDRPEVHYVDGAVRRIDSIGNELSVQRPSFEGNPFDELLSLSGACFIGITWLIRKQANLTYHFDPGIRHGEDLLFFLSIARDGIYTAVDDVIYNYRTRPDSAMQNLQGLEAGYQALEDAIASWERVSDQQRMTFRKRWKSIMVKSYLKAGHLADALRLKAT